jgi:polygalacturonase
MSKRETTRRGFLRAVGSSAAAAAMAPLLARCAPATQGAGTTVALQAIDPAITGWDRVPLILARIRPPSFADRDFDVTRYGAIGNGTTDCTDAFRRAIAECASAGGGRVIVPEGRFLTGAIHLRSRVNLHVRRGGTIAFHTDARRYLPVVFTRYEGLELMSYSPFIYAFEQTDIAVTGEGTLDGQSDNTHWWPWTGAARFGWKTGEPNGRASRGRVAEMAESNTPVEARVFGEGSYLRPNFIQPYRCRNVLIEGVRIVNSPMWEIHPVLCENVTVRNVTIVSHGPNNDGCNPESSRDVLIEGCVFDTGDDCIAIKSGRNADGRRLHTPSENIIVRNCQMRDGHGGVTIGSEISGHCRHVYVHDCRMDSPQLDRALRFKNNALRGGTLEHVYMRDVTVGQVAESVLGIDFRYEEGANGPYRAIVRDVELRNVTSNASPYALYLRGIPGSTITDVRVVDCTFRNVAKPSVMESVDGVTFKNTTINGQPVS